VRKGLFIGMVIAVLLCGSRVSGDDVSSIAEKGFSSLAEWREKSLLPWCEKTVIPWCKEAVIPAVQKAIDSLFGEIVGPGPANPQPSAVQTQTPQQSVAQQRIELTEAVKEEARLRMLELVNAERAKVGAKPLQYHRGAERVATLRGEDMVRRNYFGHIPPDETLADHYGDKGMNYVAILRREGIDDDFGISGENCAGGSKAQPGFIEEAHESLMNSPGHRGNILNPEYTHLGIGIVKGYSNNEGPLFEDGYTVVQIFLGKPR
jgi:uncharacterized protein YkwD